MSESKNITTQAHFELFKKECQYWIDYFGLLEYRDAYYHIDCGQLAQCDVHSDRTAMVCSLTLGKKWRNDTITNLLIMQSAFHEVCELLTWEIGDVVCDKTSLKNERSIFHKLIRRLENTLFTEHYKKRFLNKNVKNTK